METNRVITCINGVMNRVIAGFLHLDFVGAQYFVPFFLYGLGMVGYNGSDMFLLRF